MVNSGTIEGGDGGTGGDGGEGGEGFGGFTGRAGEGGRGGHAISGNSIEVTNEPTGTIRGGDGGSGGNGAGGGGSGGGRAAIRGSNVDITNSGTIEGGSGTDAIQFTGRTNRLELRDGYQILGNVVADGTDDSLVFGGNADSTFNLSGIGDSAQYRNFSNFRKTGSSTWTLRNGSTGSTGTWFIEAGELRITSGGTITQSAAIQIDGPSTPTLRIDGADGGGAVTTSGAITVGDTQAGRLIIEDAGHLTAAALDGGNGSSNVTLDDGTLTLSGSDSASNNLNLQPGGGTIEVAAGGDTFTLTHDITGSGGLTKTGPGTLALTASGNAYTGPTGVNAGTLEIPGADPMSGTSAFTLAGGTLRVTSPATLGQPVSLGAGGGTLAVPNQSDDLVVQGAISGAGGLTKTGEGTLVVSSAGNTYSGPTVVSGGELELSAPGTAGNTNTFNLDGGSLRASASISSGAGLSLTGADNEHHLTVTHAGDTLTLTGGLSGAGRLNKEGPGDFTLRGNGTHTGGLAIRDGGVRVDNGASLSTTGELLIDRRSSNPTSLVISGATVQTTGELALLGDFGNDGPGLFLNMGGTLSVGSIKGDGTNSALVIDGGTFESTGSATLQHPVEVGTNGAAFAVPDASDTLTLERSVGPANGGHGGLTKTGAGTLVLDAAANDYSGSTTLDGGTLEIASVQPVSATSGFAFDGGALRVTSGITLTAPVSLEAGGGTISVPNGSDDLVLQGAITGTGGLTKTGPGQLRLHGQAGYGGSTDVATGTLEVFAPDGDPAASLNGTSSIRIEGDGTQTPLLHINGTQAGAAVTTPGAVTVGDTHAGDLLIEEAVLTAAALDGGHASGGVTLRDSTLTITTPDTATNRIALESGGGMIAVRDSGETFTLDGTLTGSGGLTKTGAGTLTLGSAGNTYSGATTVRNGQLVLATAGAEGNTGSFTLEGTTLTAAETITTDVGVNLVGGGTLGVPDSGKTFSLNAPVTGSGGLTKTGAGTLQLNAGGNTWSGATTIRSGQLVLATAGAEGNTSSFILEGSTLATESTVDPDAGISLDGGGTVSVRGSNGQLIARGGITGDGGLTKTGLGLLDLPAAGSYSGPTIVEAGTLSVFGGGSISNTSEVIVDGAASSSPKLRVDGYAGGGSLQTSGSITVGDTQSGELVLRNGGEVTTAALDGGNASSRVIINDGTLRITDPDSTSVPVELSSNGGTIMMRDSGETFSLEAPVTGNGGLTTAGAGTVALRGTTNTFSGKTLVSEGELHVVNGGNITQTTEVIVDGLSDNDATLRIDGAGSSVSTTGTVTLGQGGAGKGKLILSGGGQLTAAGLEGDARSDGIRFDQGTLEITTTDTTANDLTLQAGGGTVSVRDSGETLTLDGTVAGSGGLTKTGGGTLKLNASGNTYSGSTTLQDGRLILAVAGAEGDTSDFAFNGGRLVASASITTNADISLNDGSEGIEVSGGATSLVLNGEIAGNARLQKFGAGDLALQADSTFAGGLIVRNGALQVSDGATVSTTGEIAVDQRDRGTSQLRITHGTLETDGELSLLGDFSGVDQGVFLDTGGTLSVREFDTSGANTALYFDGGTLSVDGTANPTLDHGIRLEPAGGTLAVPDGANGVTLAAGITGAGGLTKTGAGDLKLTGASDYDGPTRVDNGHLSISGGGSITTNALDGSAGVTLDDGEIGITAADTASNPVTLAGGGGTFAIPGGGDTVILNGQLTGAGALTKTGAGALQLNAAGNDYAGPTTVENGNLILAASGSQGNTSGFILKGSTLTVADPVTTQAGITLDGGGTLSVPDSGDTLSLGGSGSGSGALTKTGPGTLELTGASTYSGPAAVDGGDLRLSGGGSIATRGLNGSGPVALDDGTLTITADDTASNPMTLGAGGGTLTVSGSGHTFTQNGDLTGSGDLTKSGPGSLRLGSGSNSYSGATVVQGGSLVLAVAGAAGNTTQFTLEGATLAVAESATLETGFNLDGGGTIAVPSAFDTVTLEERITGSGGLRKDGDGTLILAATGNDFSGRTDIEGGALQLGDASTQVTLDTADGATGSDGQDEDFGNNSPPEDGEAGGDSGTVLRFPGTSGSSRSLQIASGSRVEGGAGGNGGDGGSIVVTGEGGDAGRGGDGGGGVTGNAFSLVNQGTIRGGDAGDGGTGGQGGLGPSNPNGDGGDGGDGGAGVSGTAVTVINSGTIEGGDAGAGGDRQLGVDQSTGSDGADGAIGRGVSGSDVTVINRGTIRGGLSADGSTRSPAVEFTGGDNRLELRAGYGFTGNVVADGSGDTLALGGTTDATFDVTQVGPSKSYRGFSHYRKTGTSTWTLENTTSADTPWEIASGTLSVASDDSLGDASAGLSLNGGVLRNTSAFTTGRSVTLDAGSGTFETNQDLTMTGSLNGPGSLDKTGAGTLSLTTANSYSGTTTVESGTLVASNPGSGSATGTGSVTIADGATLAGEGRIAPGPNELITVEDGGTVAPGNSIGTLTIDPPDNGTTVFEPGSSFAFELGAPGNSDTLELVGDGGTVSFNMNEVDFLDTGGLQPGEYTIVTLDAEVAYTGNLAIGEILSDGAFSGSFLSFHENSIRFTAVPEPRWFGLAAGLLGALAIGVRRARRKNNHG
ncbi:MAG: autotransporter-associated beta strand repeat-containing protein [Opitutales bacterium]